MSEHVPHLLTTAIGATPACSCSWIGKTCVDRHQPQIARYVASVEATAHAAKEK